MSNSYYVYILANKPNGTLYIGVTNDLIRRIDEHKTKKIGGFTEKYSIDQLMYYEVTDDIHVALEREKRLKRWKRQWKIDLIIKDNPAWEDLSLVLDPWSSQG